MIDRKNRKTLIQRVLENWTDINIMRILSLGKNNLMYQCTLRN